MSLHASSVCAMMDKYSFALAREFNDRERDHYHLCNNVDCYCLKHFFNSKCADYNNLQRKKGDECKEQMLANRRDSISLSQTDLEIFDGIINKYKSYDGVSDDMVVAIDAQLVRLKDFATLQDKMKVNDAIINAYMKLLQAREKDHCYDPQRSFYTNSFFYAKLFQKGAYNYRNVQRWTKNINITKLNKIYIPIHWDGSEGCGHWTLMVIYMQKKWVRHFDSCNGDATDKMQHVLRWIEDDIKDKKINEHYCAANDDWDLQQVKDTPQQNNAKDCGIFTILCADYLSDDLELNYSQKDISQWRKRIGISILNKSLPY